jgi:hypothetical protein
VPANKPMITLQGTGSAPSQVVVVNNHSAYHNGGTSLRTSQPWTDMSGNSWRNARFAEYRNTGAGAGTGANRPQLPDSRAGGDTPRKYLAGSDGWNPVG